MGAARTFVGENGAAQCQQPTPWPAGCHQRLRTVERARHVLRDPRRRIPAGPLSRRHV